MVLVELDSWIWCLFYGYLFVGIDEMLVVVYLVGYMGELCGVYWMDYSIVVDEF